MLSFLSLVILVLMAVAANAETVEVNVAGEAAGPLCDCDAEISRGSETAEQRCQQRLEAQEVSVSSPLKEKIADLEKQLNAKDALIQQLQHEKEVAEHDHNDKVLQLRRNAIKSAEHTRKVENQFTECNEMLVAATQREQSLKIESGESMEVLKTELEQAKSQKSLADSTVQKLQVELDSHKKELLQTRDDLTKQFDAETTKLIAQLDEANLHKTKADNLVEKLRGQIDTHRKDLSRSKESFEKELSSERQKFKDTHHKYFTSQRDLLKASERLAEFHKNATTTYVNLTLIQIDLTVGAIKAADWTVRVTQEARHFLAPYWKELVQTYVVPNWLLVVEQYQEHAAPLLARTKEEATKLYNEHLKETVDHVNVFFKKDVAPRLEPVKEFFNLVFQAMATLVEYGSTSMVNFLELGDFDRNSSMYQWLLGSFEYCSTHGSEVLCASLKYSFYFWVFQLVVFRKRTKGAALADRPLNGEIAPEQPKPRATVRFANPGAAKHFRKQKKNGKHQ